jgi:DNA replication protein DnaC
MPFNFSHEASRLCAGAEYTGQRVDLDAIGAAYLAKAKKTAAIREFVRNCPKDKRRFNASHPAIASNQGLARKIISWQYQDRGLLVSGSSGRGKTTAMFHLMLQLAKQGREIRYFSAFDFFGELQKQVHYGRDDAGEWVRAIARAPIVFIDDLGQESIHASRQEWAQGWFFRFLDLRSGNRLPLFVTTNLSAQEMAGGVSEVKAHPLLRRILLVCEPIKFQ